MWAAASYVSSPGPRVHVIPKPEPGPAITPRSPLSCAVSAGKPSPDDAGGLGRTILTALESNPKATNPNSPIPQKQKPKQEEEEEEEGKQISGSDVLWALQKAAAKKNKVSGKNKNKKSSRGLSSRSGYGEELVAGDYSNVRPLRVKSEWSGRLDELEKRLRELSHRK